MAASVFTSGYWRALLAGTTNGDLTSTLPKGKTKPVGTSLPNTYNPTATTQDLAIPGYREHLNDVFSDRVASDSRALIQELFKSDPDVSATVNSYLTVADTKPYWIVRDSNGMIDRNGHKELETLILALTTRFDYTKPSNFSIVKSLRALAEEMRYMVLLRGGLGAELVLDKFGLPDELRHVDLATLVWQEKAPSVFIPIQKPTHSGDRISLDIATFFTSFYRQDPTSIYSYSPFVAAINTIASRQQIINDLYRIMQMTGYPRLEVTLIEQVMRKNAPIPAQNDPNLMNEWLTARRKEIESVVSNLGANQALIHYDSATVGMVNKEMPSMSMDIAPIIEVLNAQNQAGLKVMATVIGRGSSGVNTSTVEARIFSLNADSINRPVSDILSQAFTLMLRLQGIDAIVEFGFTPAEMRPPLELETMLNVRQARYMQLLSFGLIDDDEFHLKLFNRIRPDAAPILTATHFMDTIQVGEAAGSPGATPGGDGSPTNSGQPIPTDRAVTPKDSKAAKSNTVKK